jgi:hypothetical protein
MFKLLSNTLQVFVSKVWIIPYSSTAPISSPEIK